MSRDAIPPIAWLDRVALMLDDIARIRVFIGPLDRDAFIRDDKTAFAVSYAFVRLGEATAHIPEAKLATHPEIPWVKVRSTRNIIVHVYFGIDSRSSGRRSRTI